jgi:hypothetical protein
MRGKISARPGRLFELRRQRSGDIASGRAKSP